MKQFILFTIWLGISFHNIQAQVPEWEIINSYPEKEDFQIYSIEKDQNDGFIAAGIFNNHLIAKLDSQGVIIDTLIKFEKTGWIYSPFILKKTPNQGFIFSIHYTDSIKVKDQWFVNPDDCKTTYLFIKYENQKIEWIKNLVGSNAYNRQNSPFEDIGLDSDGNIYITGISSFSGSAFLRKYSPNGNEEWETIIGDNAYFNFGIGNNLEVKDKFVYITGGIPSISEGDSTFYANGGIMGFLAKYTLEGQLVWISTFDGHDYDFGEKVIVGENGNIYLYGIISNLSDTVTTTQIGNIIFNMPLHTSFHPFISKWNPTGDVIWVSKDQNMNVLELPIWYATDLTFFKNHLILTSETRSSNWRKDSIRTNQNSYDPVILGYDSQGFQKWYIVGGSDKNDKTRNTLVTENDIYSLLSLKGPSTAVFNDSTFPLDTNRTFLAKASFPFNVSIDSKISDISHQVNLFPNPTTNTLNLKIQEQKYLPAIYNLRDLQGRIVFSKQIFFLEEKLILPELPTGEYISEIITRDEKIYRDKLLIINP